MRVGDPVRQEFAAWRYGDQFGRRRKRAMLITGAAATTAGALVVGGVLSLGSLWLTTRLTKTWYLKRVVLRTRNQGGAPVRVLRKHLYTSRLVPDGEGRGWGLRVDHLPGWSGGDKRETMIIHGREAIGLAGQLMAQANRRGGRESAIRRAVRRIEHAGHPEAFLPEAADMALHAFQRSAKDHPPARKIERLRKPLPGTLAGMSESTRLAIEMATHEEAEREALEGELKELEARWREAEAIARIADNLLVPESVDGFIAGEHERIDVDPMNPSRNV